jgi:hypothetical protein
LATVILTIRSGESPPDAITATWKDQHLERLELQPLSLPEIADLVEHVLGGPVDSFSAQRLWQYTQGNALYLRHLLENEVNAGRMTQRSGIWLWDGEPKLSPTLAELLESRLAEVPTSVHEVLDALAVAEPLETDVLEAIADADALAEAESLGLITVDASVRPASVRLAHPLLGEIRRTGSLRLRRLRGRIAAELTRKGSTDPRDLIRRAVLTIESDLTPRFRAPPRRRVGRDATAGPSARRNPRRARRCRRRWPVGEDRARDGDHLARAWRLSGGGSGRTGRACDRPRADSDCDSSRDELRVPPIPGFW